MKLISRYKTKMAAVLAAATSCFLVVATAQEPPPQGGFRFVNASGIPGKTMVTIDSAKLRADGFAPGDTTGAIGILAGAHRFSADHPGTGKAETNVNVQANTFTTVVAYAKPVLDPQTKKPTQILQLLARSDPPRGKGKHFQILSVSARPALDVLVNGQAVNLQTLRELQADNVAKGSIKIEYAGRQIVEFVAQESGSFLAVLFDQPDGSVGAVLLPDYG